MQNKQNRLTKSAAAAAKSLQSCPTLCDPIDGSLLGSSVPGILQARILEWVAISFSNISFLPSVKYQVFLYMWIFSWALYSVPSVCLFIPVNTVFFFNCRFIIIQQLVGYYHSSFTSPSIQNCLSCFSLLYFHTKLRITFITMLLGF